MAGGIDEVDDIAYHRFAYIGLGHQFPQILCLAGGEQGRQLCHGVAILAAEDHVGFILAAGITQAQPDHKPVHLAVRQGLGAGGAGGVLGGNDDKWLGNGMADAVHRYLAFFHGLQQGGLGPGSGPVQLVRQEQITQHRTGLIDHAACGLVQNGVAGHIGGQHVRGKLDPVAL